MKKRHEEKKLEKNEKGEGKYAYGGPIKLKDCKVNTVEKNPKHKKF
jgi:hypothetical protein